MIRPKLKYNFIRIWFQEIINYNLIKIDYYIDYVSYPSGKICSLKPKIVFKEIRVNPTVI